MVASMIKGLMGTALLCLPGLMLATASPLAAQTLPGSLPEALTGPGSTLFGRSGFLPVDEAFAFYTAVPSPGTVTLHWRIAPEYYLYRDKFAVTLSLPEQTAQAVSLDLPPGVAHHDEFFGDVDVFYDALELSVPIPAAFRNASYTLTVRYQGCAEAGLCYPEQQREVLMQPQASQELQ